MFPEDGIVCVETCRDYDEFNLISEAYILIDCTVIIYNELSLFEL
jgi:hypothetical protein